MQLKALLHASVVVAALVPGGSSRASTVAIADSIEVAPLRKSRTERDCGAQIQTDCRVLRGYSADSIRSKLANGIHVWPDGDEITFATEMKATAVEVSGGLQYPMSRIHGTDLWVVTLREKGLDSAVVSYFFIGLGPSVVKPAKFTPSVWRGPRAPKQPPTAKALKGRLIVDTLKSRYLASGERDILIYVPPARGSEPVRGVVYLGDGGSVTSLAKLVDTLTTSGSLPRIMLVGIPSPMPRPGDPPGQDLRAMEYLWGFEDGNKHFIAHENFWLHEVIPYAEKRYGAPRDRVQRATWGISNSAAWAIDMGLRHPEVVGNVIAFSPGGRHGEIYPNTVLEPAVRFFIQGGTMESAFHRIALSWGDSLKARGVNHVVKEVVAGHDWTVWHDTFPGALEWAFAR